jgi:hypothetical protein
LSNVWASIGSCSRFPNLAGLLKIANVGHGSFVGAPGCGSCATNHDSSLNADYENFVSVIIADNCMDAAHVTGSIINLGNFNRNFNY